MEKVKPFWSNGWMIVFAFALIIVGEVADILSSFGVNAKLRDQATIIEAQRVRASLLEARVSSLVGSIDAMRADARARDGL